MYHHLRKTQSTDGAFSQGSILMDSPINEQLLKTRQVPEPRFNLNHFVDYVISVLGGIPLILSGIVFTPDWHTWELADYLLRNDSEN
jgi:hypothetical protein